VGEAEPGQVPGLVSWIPTVRTSTRGGAFVALTQPPVVGTKANRPEVQPGWLNKAAPQLLPVQVQTAPVGEEPQAQAPQPRLSV